MSNEALVLVKDHGRVRVLTLNRPKSLNAFNDAQYDALSHALRDAADAPPVSVVVLTGAGRAFSAGQDLGELGSPPYHDDGLAHGFQPFMDVLQSFPKPLIAAVNGLGVGIGLTMLPHCDLVLIARGAKLRAPFVSLGVTAEAASTVLLPDAIGWAGTAHLLYTADWITGEDAAQIGLAWKCVDDGSLMAVAMAEAERIAAMPVTSLVATKRLLVAGRIDAINRARARENKVFAGLVGGAANREAVAAFHERRAPDFSRIV